MICMLKTWQYTYHNISIFEMIHLGLNQQITKLQQ